MTTSTVGRLLGIGDFGVRDSLRIAVAQVSGRGPNIAYPCDVYPSEIRDSFPRLPFVTISGNATLNGGYSGNYKIAGITQLNGVAIARRVLLAPQLAPTLIIREAYTGGDGVFSFSQLAPGQYIAWSMTNDGSRDIVAHEYIAAVPG